MKHAEKLQAFQVRDGALAGWLKPHDGDIHRTEAGKPKFCSRKEWNDEKEHKKTNKKQID